MSLAFLVPAFLFGLIAIGVPIVVHLRQREQREPVRFPSLMFLARIVHRTTERRRIANWKLLLLRALAVAALVLAFTRPFLEREPDRLLATRRRALVLVVDRSMSMGYQGVWARALDSARAAVAGLEPGERAGLIAVDDSAEVLVPLTADRTLLSAALDRFQPRVAGSRLASGLGAGSEMAADSRGEAAELVLISDLQRGALEGLETADVRGGVSVRIVSVGAQDPVNARVTSVAIDRAVSGRQASLRVAANVAMKGGGTAPRSSRARLVVNGRELATAAMSLTPNDITQVAFPAVLVPDAAATAAVRLEADALPADDEFRFVIGEPAGVPVLLVATPSASGGELLYLERALEISRSPRFQVRVRRGAPTAADLQSARVIVAADLAPLLDRSSAIEAFLTAGGGVVAFAGPRPGRSGVGDRWLPARVGKVVDRSDERGGRLGWIETDHPIFEVFREAAGTDFGAARFYRYRDLEADSSARALARFDDARPALLERRVGAGRVVTWASAPDALWSDLPLQPAFLPLIHRLVGFAAAVGAEKQAWEVGDVADLPTSADQVVVTDPAGGVARLEAADAARGLTLGMTGYYQIRPADGSAGPLMLAVNPPAGESDVTAAPVEEAAALVRASADSTDRGPTPLTPVEQEAEQRWWGWLLATVLAFLAIETWYANRLSARPPRKEAAR